MIIALVPELRVMAVVKVSRELNQYNSNIQENIKIKIPTGLATKKKDWFPIMNVYYDENGFGNTINREVELTVLYNYGDFNSLFGTSLYYDSSSPYYGGYYGAYIIQEKTATNSFYGFDEMGNLILEEIERIPSYDQIHLALACIDCEPKKRIFKVEANEIEENIPYLGYEGWTRVDSSIYTNGPAHKKEKFQFGYLQYGNPLANKESNEDFKAEDFFGRMYIRAFEESHMTICLYIMAIDKKVLEDCDRELLANTIIK